MQPYTPPLSRTLRLATIMLFTASLLVPGLAFAQDSPQDGQIDQQITKTMWVMHPDVVGHIDRLDQLRVPYLESKEIERELLNNPPYNPQKSTLPDRPDGAMQTFSGPLVPGSVGLSFDGLGEGITGPNGTFTVNSVPPDPNLAVGTTQMIQTVNSGFAIYNKSTGAMTLGPYTIQTLWSTLPAGSPCTGSNGISGDAVSMSDPVVSFDNFAQRWIVTILALPYNTSTGAYVPPMYHCVAFSNSADAGGAWTIFEYNPGGVVGIPNDLPDYPKQGVWRDAYTFTYDMFNATGSAYVAGVICGLDRNAILGGSLSPTIICFEKTSSDYAMLPATMDGSTYPPLQTSGTAGTDTCSSGSPCQPKSIFFELQDVAGSSTRLEYYRVHFNFVTTSHSAVETRGNITVSSYNTTTCTNTSQCAVQPTHTGSLPAGETFASESKLDTLADHAMWRAAYRNFGSYESVVFDSSVNAGPAASADPRWYELRGINSSTGTGTPTVFQQSTFNPDSGSLFRFMGSIAADHNNNMLLGYTGSNSGTFPSLYVTGRLVGDGVSTMETEQKVFAGLNSQVNITGYAYGYRWGDYSSVVVDPDDCTFWYTNEYEAQAGLFNWSTRIFNWNFGSSNCTSLASITLPIPNSEGGAALTSATATFLWTSGTGTPTYTLAVGSTQGASNYCGGPQSYGAGVYTATLSCLPVDGSTFWVRLTSITTPGGFQDYQYTAASLSQPTTTTVASSLNPSTYGQSVNFTATVTSSGNPVTSGTVQFVVDGSNFGSAGALNGSGQATSGSTSTLTATTHAVQANYSGSGSYLASSGSLTQTVNQASQTITFTTNAPSNAAYNTSFGVAATASSGLTVAFTASGSCSVVDNGNGTANYTMTSGTGTCSVIANQAGNTNYSAAPTVTETTNATQATQTITFTTNAPSSATYGTQFTVAATGGGSGNPVVFTSSGSCTNSGATYTMTSGTGTCSVIANQAGNSNYSAAPQVTENTTAIQAVLTVTANNAGMIYGGTPPALTYTITGFQFSDNQGNSTTGQPLESTTATSSSPVGVYAIFISQGTLAAANYTFGFVNGNLTIGPATLTVTADNKTATEGNGLPTFTATYSGFVNGDNQGVLSGFPLFGTDAPSGPPVGTWNIFVTQGTLGATNYTFAFVNGTLTVNPAVAQITAPPKSSMFSGDTVNFTWSHETGATVYQLNLGSTAGGRNIASYETTNLGATMSNLPTDGSLIYATLLGSVDYTHFTQQDTAVYAAYSVTAVMISPIPNTAFTGSSVTFNWVAGAGSSAYWIDVGSAPFGNTYYQSGNLGTALTATVNGLPSDGSPVYVTLWSLVNGQWQNNEYTYTAYNNSSIKGTMQTPAPGSTLSGSSVAFTWTAGTQSTAYWLDAGSAPFGNNYYQSGNLGNVLTTTATGLPSDGSTVYVTLWSLVNGQWLNNQYTYTAYSAGQATGQITTPTPGSTFTGPTVTFDWTAGTGSSAYWLDVGSTPGGNQYYQSGNLGNVLTATVNNLPTDGSTVYVTLYSLVGSQWVANAYTYTAFRGSSGLGVMQTPTPGTTLSGNQATFTWSAGTGATAYWLDIGSAPGGNQYYQSGNLGNVLTTTVYSLPADGSTIYVTLYSLVGGQWLSNAYTYTSGP